MTSIDGRIDSIDEHGPFGREAAETLEHLNDEHDDTVTMLGRVLCDAPDAVSATLTGVHHDGVQFVLAGIDGATRTGTATFANRAATSDAAQVEFFGLIVRARALAGDREPLTSLERELSGVTVIPTHVTSVAAVIDLSPRLRQITLQGGLERFVPGAPDQFVYVLAPPRGTNRLTIDESFSWDAYEAMPAAERPVGAYYTVRRWEAGERSLDLWVVLHGHDGDGEHWARHARPGDPVALWGPRHAYERDATAQTTDSLLLMGDETALPAIAAIAERLDPADRATVIVALDIGAEPIEFESPAAVDVYWIADDQPAALLDAVAGLPAGTITPTTYAWGGAESHAITAVRRYLRDVKGLPRDQVSMTGYWRRAG